MDRIYTKIIESHLSEERQMAFVAGPRQVGKTTISLQLQEKYPQCLYLNWDSQKTKELILSGQEAVATQAKLSIATDAQKLIIFDEIHKYSDWKNFLKGFFDLYHTETRILVTGSAKLDIYQKGGDSLMGRYFIYHIHPLTLRECLRPTVSQTDISDPIPSDLSVMAQLLKFGGFPEPFLKNKTAFYNRWQKLKKQQLFREDIRELINVKEIGDLELLAILLESAAGQLLNYSNLANKIGVSVNTIQRWMEHFESIYYSFRIYPWTKNITRSLLKEPKIYLWDWSTIKNQGQCYENLIASHLYKAVSFWTDRGLGDYQLYFLRDKEKNEIDFLVTKNEEPWFLVEAKMSANQGISKALHHFQKLSGAKHALQVCSDLPFVNKNCFEYDQPMIVSAATFLSQLV
jgi:predicted AAA+ superfamily ATPase